MKKKQLFKLLTIAPVVLLAACNGGSGEGSGVYTLREFTAALSTNWNPHTWEMNNDSAMLSYTTMGWVETTYDADTGSYEWTYEMAESITDVTKTVSPEVAETWGVNQEEEAGRIWDIKLRDDLKFHNGHAITAETYAESMQLCLDPTMKNYRANNYYSSDTEIAGAYAYYMQGSTIYADTFTAATQVAGGATYVDGDDSYFFNVETAAIWAASGMSYTDFSSDGDYAYYMTITDASGAKVNLIDKYLDYAEENGSPAKMTDEVIAELASAPFLPEAFGVAATAENVIGYLGSQHLSMATRDFDSVGIFALDSTTLRIVLANELSEFYFKLYMLGDWLVDPEVYRANMTTTAGLTTTKYNADFETCVSYGPYKMTSYEDDKQVTLARDENWYGWTDGKHEGQYQTTNIVIDVIENHSTALQSFLQGGLDGIDLETADVATYGYSDYLLTTPDSYSGRIVFNTDVDKLGALEHGSNAKILAVEDFRKGFNVMMNRSELCNAAFPGHQPLLGLIGNMYYYDAEDNPNSVYRNTDAAKEVILEHYGVTYGPGSTYETLEDAYAATTGYDVEAARAYFTSAAAEAIEKGYWDGTSAIVLDLGLYDASLDSSVAFETSLNTYLTAATVGTALEGKVSVKGTSYNGETTRYDAIMNGLCAMAHCAWGGAVLNPYGVLRCYTDPSYADIQETVSYDPTVETITMELDLNGNGTIEETTDTSNEKITDTYQHWTWNINNIQGYGKYVSNDDIRFQVMTEIESALLGLNIFTMVNNYGSVSLRSAKIDYPTYEYNMFYGYGGLRYLSYNYDDAQWSSFVSSHGGDLSEVYR